jgi:hypothetical protein
VQFSPSQADDAHTPSECKLAASRFSLSSVFRVNGTESPAEHPVNTRKIMKNRELTWIALSAENFVTAIFITAFIYSQ